MYPRRPFWNLWNVILPLLLISQGAFGYDFLVELFNPATSNLRSYSNLTNSRTGNELWQFRSKQAFFAIVAEHLSEAQTLSLRRRIRSSIFNSISIEIERDLWAALPASFINAVYRHLSSFEGGLGDDRLTSFMVESKEEFRALFGRDSQIAERALDGNEVYLSPYIWDMMPNSARERAKSTAHSLLFSQGYDVKLRIRNKRDLTQVAEDYTAFLDREMFLRSHAGLTFPTEIPLTAVLNDFIRANLWQFGCAGQNCFATALLAAMNSEWAEFTHKAADQFTRTELLEYLDRNYTLLESVKARPGDILILTSVRGGENHAAISVGGQFFFHKPDKEGTTAFVVSSRDQLANLYLGSPVAKLFRSKDLLLDAGCFALKNRVIAALKLLFWH